MLKEKNKGFHDDLLDKLVSSVKDQKDFWETVHKMSSKRKAIYNNISVDSWFQHFRVLFEKMVILMMRSLLKIAKVFSIDQFLRKKFCVHYDS